MKLILISGIPASGKTTIANKLSKDLRIKLVTKDQEKEKLFETESKSSLWRWGWYEKTANKNMLKELNKYIKDNEDLVLESNFAPILKKERRTVKNEAESNTDIREIHCTAKGYTILRRFVKRNEQRVKTKHPFHHDRMWYPAILLFSLMKHLGVHFPYTPMKLSKKVLIVDTTKVEKIDYEKIEEFCK